MEDLFEPLSCQLSDSRFYRLKYFPLEEALKTRPTAKLPTPEGVGKREDAPKAQKVSASAALPRSLREYEERRWMARQATMRLIVSDGVKKQEKRRLAEQATRYAVSTNGVRQAGGDPTSTIDRPGQQEKIGIREYSPEFESSKLRRSLL